MDRLLNQMRYVWAVENWEKSTNKNNIRTEELSPSQIIVNDLKLKIEKPNTWPLHAVIKDRFLNFLSLLNKMDKKAPWEHVGNELKSELWCSLFYNRVPGTSETSATRAWHERRECDTSEKLATRVRRDCFMNDTSATPVLHEGYKCDTSEEFWFW